MLVEFHPDFKTQVNDKIHYNIVPWLSTAATETHTPAAQSTNTGTDASRVASLEPRDSTRVAAQDLRRIEEARAAKCCTWKDCSLTLPFSDDATLKTHLECHAQDVIQRWSGESGCKWSGCASKEIFKRLSSLKLHLENVHVKPLLCARLGCSFKRPFRNLSDLQRHVKSKHSHTGVVRCPYKECMSSTRTFVRKDKWLQHVQDAEHQLDNFCPVRHCEKEVRGRFGGFKDPKEVIKHMFNEHAGTSAEVRDFSCAIGGCEAGGPPFLTKDQLRRHLQVDHSLMWHAATEVIDAVEATEIHQVQAQLVPTGIKFAPCELCSLSSTSPPLNDGKFKLAPLDQSQVACLERFPDFAPERRRGSFYDSPPPRPRRQRSRKVIYCVSYLIHGI
jgi:hypothetical protein